MFFLDFLDFQGHILLTNLRYAYLKVITPFSPQTYICLGFVQKYETVVYMLKRKKKTFNCLGNYDFTLNFFLGSFVTKNHCQPYF